MLDLHVNGTYPLLTHAKTTWNPQNRAPKGDVECRKFDRFFFLMFQMTSDSCFNCGTLVPSTGKRYVLLSDLVIIPAEESDVVQPPEDP